MPTLCSMCGGTYGHCESCKKADFMAKHHENPAAGAALTKTLESFAKPATPATQTPAETDEAKARSMSIVFSDIIHRQCIAMQAAVIDGHLNSPAEGLRWIANTLWGPGLLPDLDEAKAIGGAQAWFDREVAAAEKFRAEHPTPAPRAVICALMLTEQQRELLSCAAVYLESFAADQRQAGNDSQAAGCMASAHAISQLLCKV